ncbi:MAG: hypothetical protein MUE65_00830 [Methanomassiliicoccales archaeon]|nr:hypothetical protein [Methanomassiliicoccales archaeon]
MWKVLGEETVIPMMADVWVKRMVELSKRRKEGSRFVKMIEDADVRYVFDAVREVNSFIIQMPPKYGKEDLEFMRAYVQRVNKGIKFPVVELEGQEQRFAVVITSEAEEDDYAWRRSHRSDYFKWVEEQSEAGKEEQDF